jgi:hypothetical protein
MEEVSMATQWRTVQFFIGDEGVSEVELDSNDSSKVRCSCQKYASMRRCKHVKFVKDRINKTSGEYSVSIPDDVPDEETENAIADYVSWRNYIIKYGEIEAI